MTPGLYTKLLFSVLWGVAFAIIEGNRYDEEDIVRTIDNPGREKKDLYRPTVDPTILVTVALFVPVVFLLLTGDIVLTGRITGDFLLPIFFTILVYYTILLTFLPMIRRKFTSRFCATLWILPNVLYLASYAGMQRVCPGLTIRVSSNMFKWMTIIWLTGFLAVIIYYIISHLIYRKYVMTDAYEPEKKIIDLWESRQLESGLKKAYTGVRISPSVSTPMVIGLFKRSTCLLLPERKYSMEDMDLIMEHELIHILRSDSQTKFFLAASKALSWFNPFMWAAMKKCAEDLELSCDELMIQNASAEERMQYAGLILHTAGDERGFTTCLSANAESLKYRLRGITEPDEKRKGIILVGMITAVILMLHGGLSIAYDVTTVGDRYLAGERFVLAQENVSAGIDGTDEFTDSELYDELIAAKKNAAESNEDAAEQYILKDEAILDDGLSYKYYEISEKDELTEYIRALEISKVTGVYDFENKKCLNLTFLTDDGERVDIDIGDRWVKCNIVHQYGPNSLLSRSFRDDLRQGYKNVYYLTEEPDWDYIKSLIKVK